ncbi:MAG: nuclear transport factor 2 family protein [Flavobacteriaceae bacterium]
MIELKKYSLLSIFIMALACNSNTSLKDDEIAIKNTLIDMWDAIETEDVDRYASYIHDDFTQFGETDPTLNVGKQIEVEGVRDWIKTSENIHTEMLDPKVTIKDNVAWITYYWADHGTTDGKPFATKVKSTRIFVKENGKWLCIHGHYTLLP